MIQSYAVIDLETTGPKFAEGDRIFQFGCTIIEQRRIVSTYEFFICPEQPIPTTIQTLTGITNEMVATAPYFEEVAPMITQLLEDKVIIAHNVGFDYPFLAQSLKELVGISWEATCIDTVQLAQICLPTAEGYRLSDLTSFLHIEHRAVHSAGSDAKATASLFLTLMERLERLPTCTLEQMRLFSDQLVAQTGSIIENILSQRPVAYEMPREYTLVDGLAICSDVLLSKREKNPPVSLSAKELYHQLVEQAVIQEKDAQKTMLEFLMKRLLQKEPLSWLQAEPGSGKTLVYLLASLATASLEQPIWIATPTLLLQQQLVEQAFKPLCNQLKIEVSFASIKGKHQYIALSGLNEILDNFVSYQNQKNAVTIMGVLVWLTQTRSGDLGECSQALYHAELWKKLGVHDPSQESFDFYQKAWEDVHQSAIVFTNQAFLFQALSHNHSFKRPIVLIDEVQQFESVLFQQGKTSIQFDRLWEIQEKWQVYYLDNQLILSSRLDFQLRTINRLLLEMSAVYEEWLVFFQEESFSSTTILLQSHQWQSSKHRIFLQKIRRLIVRLGSLLEGVDDELARQTHDRLTGLLRQLQSIHDLKHEYLALTLEEEHHQLHLKVEKIISSHELWLKVAKYADQIIGISATIPQYTPLFYSVVSPKDTLLLEAKSPIFQHLVMLPTDLPVPELEVTQQGAQQLACQIQQIYQRVQGRMLILLHSTALLEAVEPYLSRQLSDQSVELLVQRSAHSSRKIQRKFQQENHVILLGVYSFWEGFDSQGVSIDQLVMVRLPFPNPKRLEQLVVAAELQLQQRDYFKDYALPKMLQQFWQGLGRMNRPTQQPAEIWILDVRASRSNYARKIRQVIPKGAQVIEKTFKKLIRYTKKE